MRRRFRIPSPSMSQLMLTMTVAIVLITAVSIMLVVEHKTTRAMLDSEDRLAASMLAAVRLNVENEYRSMLYLRDSALEQRKAELKDVVNLASSISQIYYEAYTSGRHTQAEAQRMALDHLRRLRYDNGYGYIWVSTMNPKPLIIMHPGLSKAARPGAEDPRLYKALDNGQNLLTAFSEICRQQGAGFITYHWAKPTAQGLIENQHKLSYVELFKGWNWILGTGLYVDDIEAATERRKAAIIKELQQSLPQLELGHSGYIYIFDGRRNMLVHPSLRGAIADRHNLPAKSSRLMDAQMRAARQPGTAHEYLWDKPGHEGDFSFKKRTYSTYFAPLDWYIVASVYVDEIEAPAARLSHAIIMLTGLFCGLAVILALLAAKLLARPLQLLSHAAQTIAEQGLGDNAIPISGPRETRHLGLILTRMAASIKKTTGALRENETKYRSLFENSNDAILILLAERIVDCNRKTLEIFGRSRAEIIDRTPMDLSPELQPDGQASQPLALRKVSLAMSGQSQFFEWLCSRPDGTTFDCEIYLTRLDFAERAYLHAIVRDISERKQAEAERKHNELRLRQAQKMEAIGTLAGGIAHDFNNILTGILGYGDLALDEVDENERAARHLRELLKAAERAKALVRQILTFSRQVETEVVALKPQLIIKEALQLLRASIPATIAIEQTIDPAAGTVMADPSQLHQVIMNLCTNAYSAMPEGGTLTVTLANCRIDAADLPAYQGLQAGAHVCLQVSDTGCGMDNETLQHIFEPFFTTKPKGEGTGLGLATVHGIVKSLKGDITVSSEPGRGTCFSIYLPTVAVTASEQLDEAVAFQGHGELILLVDDEAQVLKLGRLQLERMGYTIRAFNDPNAALAAFSAEPAAFALIITDYAMPLMTGAQLARAIKTIRPEIPIVMASGYAPQDSDNWLATSGITTFVEKPFDKNKLYRAIEQSLLAGKPPNRLT